MIEKNVIKREITCKIDLHPFEGKNYGYYIIIPFTMEESSQKKAATRRLFWLRIFTSEQTVVEPVKETLMIEEKGEWTETKHCGPMYFKIPPKQGSKDEKLRLRFNPYWCQNPQYFLNIKQPTHLKVQVRLIRSS